MNALKQFTHDNLYDLYFSVTPFIVPTALFSILLNVILGYNVSPFQHL